MPCLSIVASILPPDLWAIGLELGDQGSLNQSTRCSALKQLIIFAGRIGFRNPRGGRWHGAARSGKTRFVPTHPDRYDFAMVPALSFVIAKVVHAVTGLRFGAEAEEQRLGP
jgi:hypothetical protein